MDKELSVKLIQLYGNYRFLWDAQCPEYTNRGLRKDAWRNISREMKLPVADLKKKMESLMGSYRREKSRERIPVRVGRHERYVSNWYAYGAFSFMEDKRDPGKTQNNLRTQNSSRIDREQPSDNEQSQRQCNNADEILDDKRRHVVEESPSGQKPQRDKSKKKAKKRSAAHQDTLAHRTVTQAFKLLEQCVGDGNASLQRANDTCDAFGQYIAQELRKYDDYTLAHVKNAISRIIFEADTGAHKSLAPNSGCCSQTCASTYSTSDSSSSIPSPKPPSLIPSTSPMPPPPIPPTLPPLSNL